jgi:hypothetical protein
LQGESQELPAVAVYCQAKNLLSLSECSVGFFAGFGFPDMKFRVAHSNAYAILRGGFWLV